MTFEDWIYKEIFNLDGGPRAVAKAAWQAAYRAGQEDMIKQMCSEWYKQGMDLRGAFWGDFAGKLELKGEGE